MSTPGFRPLPVITPETEPFWKGGADGTLRICRCGPCGTYVHPPVPVCPSCRSRDVAPQRVSGRGVVHSFSINHQVWNPTLEHPYAVVVVELEEQAGLRLVSNLVDCDPEAAAIGMPVTVAFEEQGEVFFPVFRPTGEALRPDPGPGRVAAPAVARWPGEVGERKAIVSGVGQSAIGRRLFRSPMDLTIEAASRAVERAGLRFEDIDGLAAYPGSIGDEYGFAGPGTPAVQDALRLNLNWHRGGLEGPAQFSAIFDAIAAVAAGLARHVLVYRTVTEATATAMMRQAGSSSKRSSAFDPGGSVTGHYQWMVPFHAYSAATWTAWHARRYMHEFGLTKPQLGEIALNGRRNAMRNPDAVYREPMTMEDYLGARIISTPLGLFDCDAPCDGSTAIVFSHRDCAADLPGPAVEVLALGSGLRGRPLWDQWEDLTCMASRDAAAHLWSRTDLRARDVDVAELYDGFSFLTVSWLEAFGFFGRGEAGPYLEGGALGRDLPLNTHGGQLSQGRLHGFGFLHEAVVQLRGEAGERQVEGAEIALAAAGGGPVAGCLLLARR